jgi:hypothetical protein
VGTRKTAEVLEPAVLPSFRLEVEATVPVVVVAATRTAGFAAGDATLAAKAAGPNSKDAPRDQQTTTKRGRGISHSSRARLTYTSTKGTLSRLPIYGPAGMGDNRNRSGGVATPQ